MFREQKGITLIALVITIIVLLILAGVSIAMLSGENGILSQSRNAKKSQIEGEVSERIKLAVQAARMYSEEKAVETSSGWLASGHIGTNDDTKNADTIVGQLKNDLGSEYTYTPDATNKTLKVKYVSDGYKSATNSTVAYIEATVTISNNTFTITSINAYRDGSTATSLSI